MDREQEIVLEEHATVFVADKDGQAAGAAHGLYERGTRLLARYVWHFLPTGGDAFRTVLAESPRPGVLEARYALGDEAAPPIAVCRSVSAHALGLHDELEVSNTSRERLSLSLELEVATDASPPGHAQVDDRHLALAHSGPDGVHRRILLAFDALAAARPDGADWELSLAPGEQVHLHVHVHVATALSDDAAGPADERA